MRVIYFNNCWFTNVGEAFIDIGGLEFTKKVFGDTCNIACISAMTDYYCNNAPERRKHYIKNQKGLNSFKMSDHLNADYVVLPGQVGTLEYLNAPSEKMVNTLADKGCRPVFLGLGCQRYDKTESEALKGYFQRVKPALIVSRDNETYELFKDVAPCVKGLDMAFWSVDKFDPRGFADRSYEVITFNRTPEPEELKTHTENVVRPWHMQYEYRKEDYHELGMISDSPLDYLTLYANAERVYTDLVHATIVSLMYGTPVKCWKTDERSRAFYALEGLTEDDGWLSVSMTGLAEQKENIVSESRAILSGK